LTLGRACACVREWLGEQSKAFRKRIEIVVIDPSAPYASGIRAALPDAKLAVDIWHLVALANQMVTEVRQQVTRLATTVETWWRALLVALTNDVSNARTEGITRPLRSAA
jgi:transposase